MKSRLISEVFIYALFVIIIDALFFVIVNLITGKTGGLLIALLLIRLIAIAFLFILSDILVVLIFKETKVLKYHLSIACFLTYLLLPFGISVMTALTYFKIYTDWELYYMIMLPFLIASIIFYFLSVRFKI